MKTSLRLSYRPAQTCQYTWASTLRSRSARLPRSPRLAAHSRDASRDANALRLLDDLHAGQSPGSLPFVSHCRK